MDFLDQAKRDLRPEDIAEKYREVAESAGMDNYIRLCEDFGGCRIYLPTVKELCKNYIYARVMKSKDILSIQQLARMYGLSEATVYKLICKAKREESGE